MRYLVEDWDGNRVVFPCFRKAKAAWRTANRETYCAWIKVYRGPVKRGMIWPS